MESEQREKERGKNWGGGDWNVLCIKIKLDNEGQLNPLLQHLLLASQLCRFSRTAINVFKMTHIEYFELSPQI